MLNLQHTKTFLAIIDSNGFRAAARHLQLSPSTIVDHINQLEKMLAAPLLVRRRGAVEPTAQGSAFIPLARALIETAERARDVVHGAPFRLAASSNIGIYLLQTVLADFQRAHDTIVDLWIGPNPAVADRIETGMADLAIMEWWDGRTGFDAIMWRREPLVVIVPPGHALAKHAVIYVTDLIEHPILGGEHGTGTGRLLSEKLGDASKRLKTRSGFGSTEAVKHAVRSGLGISIVLAAAVVDEVDAGQLVAIPIGGIELAKDTLLIAPVRRPDSASATRFIEHVTRMGTGTAGRYTAIPGTISPTNSA